ncbi:hypothetical protein AHAS_Ahas13G0391200 [Arachis hypogaea]
MIFGLLIKGMLMLRFTDSSITSLENKFMIQFGIVPTIVNHKGSQTFMAPHPKVVYAIRYRT